MPKSISTVIKERRQNAIDTSNEYSQLFGQAIENSRIKSIPISRLSETLNQPFLPYSSEKLDELSESISEYGLLNPIIVRPLENGDYQILSGHNRKRACEQLGWKDIPAIVYDCDDDKANLIMLDSNLNQRQKLLHSERAKAFYRKYEILKRQGKRTDLDEPTSTQNAWKKETASLMANSMGTSKDNIRRHIRLMYLHEDILNAVDNKAIPFMVGVNLSYLGKEEQEILVAIIGSKWNIKVAQSEVFRQKSQTEGLTEKYILSILFPVKSTPKNKTIKFSVPKSTELEELISTKKDRDKLFNEFLNWLKEHKVSKT